MSAGPRCTCRRWGRRPLPHQRRTGSDPPSGHRTTRQNDCPTGPNRASNGTCGVERTWRQRPALMRGRCTSTAAGQEQIDTAERHRGPRPAQRRAAHQAFAAVRREACPAGRSRRVWWGMVPVRVVVGGGGGPEALANLRRCTARGGRIAFTTWADLADNPWRWAPAVAASELLGEPLSLPHTDPARSPPPSRSGQRRRRPAGPCSSSRSSAPPGDCRTPRTSPVRSARATPRRPIAGPHRR